MSKEAMKLAASVLKGSQEYKRGNATFVEAVEELEEALAKPDFWEGYVPEPVKPAQQALDKKAENARELGLDYEPVQQPVAVFREVKVGEYVLRFWPSDNGWMCGITSEMMQALAEQPAQQQSCYCLNCEALSKELAELKAQQPFGYFKAMPFGWTDCAETDEGAVALYERPPAQRTWVGMTDDEREIASWTDGSFGAGARWADAKLKEKNT